MLYCGAGPVSIGRNCDLGQRVNAHTVSHELGDSERRAGTQRMLATSIGDGCWIGAGSTILPGVTIGSGCIVGAGSVVTASCEPDGLCADVPAKRVRDLDLEIPDAILP